MGMFSTFNTVGSALTVNRTWMDAIANNLANINTVRPTTDKAFQAQYVIAQANDYGKAGNPGVNGGTHVVSIAQAAGDGKVVYEPDHPLADGNGYVRYPEVDMADQMTQLIVAQRSYQANLSVFQRALDSYQQALQIGKGN
jgi:flagellar basal-body rod protein FlgC